MRNLRNLVDVDCQSMSSVIPPISHYKDLHSFGFKIRPDNMNRIRTVLSGGFFVPIFQIALKMNDFLHMVAAHCKILVLLEFEVWRF